MPETFNSAVPISDRIEKFIDYYGDFGDAGNVLPSLLIGCGKFLSEILGEELANKAMTAGVMPFFPDSGAILAVFQKEADEPDWAFMVEYDQSDAFSIFPAGPKLYELSAYSQFGVTISKSDESCFSLRAGATEEERAAHIKGLLDFAENLYQMSPMQQWKIGETSAAELESLVILARNRWELDHGRPIDAVALAAFGGVSEGTMRNLMSGSNRLFQSEKGLIPAQDALAWLENRPGYWNSVWRDQARLPVNPPTVEGVSVPVFVPVAKDGSVFHPGLRTANGFMVGKKGEEEKHETFIGALAALQRMGTAYWRRPNDKGRRGIVKGVKWERMESSFLDQIADQPDYRLKAPLLG